VVTIALHKLMLRTLVLRKIEPVRSDRPLEDASDSSRRREVAREVTAAEPDLDLHPATPMVVHMVTVREAGIFQSHVELKFDFGILGPHSLVVRISVLPQKLSDSDSLTCLNEEWGLAAPLMHEQFH
jgi:hypothetical protein